MLSVTLIAVFLSVCLAVFFLINVHNIVRFHRHPNRARSYAEVERPWGFVVALAVVGTLVYFLAVLAFMVLVFVDLGSVLSSFSFGYMFPFIDYVQILGLVLTVFGYSLFIWSVIVRGKYAVSWEMPEHQKLVTSGPYRYVRHPSYLGYFLMFIGLFLLWPNLFTAFSIVAIPGYYRLTFEEERLLLLRFGENYVEYQQKTGRFIPKLY